MDEYLHTAGAGARPSFVSESLLRRYRAAERDAARAPAAGRHRRKHSGAIRAGVRSFQEYPCRVPRGRARGPPFHDSGGLVAELQEALSTSHGELP